MSDTGKQEEEEYIKKISKSSPLLPPISIQHHNSISSPSRRDYIRPKSDEKKNRKSMTIQQRAGAQQQHPTIPTLQSTTEMEKQENETSIWYSTTFNKIEDWIRGY